MSQTKTIFITAYHSFIGRNILGSRISDILKAEPEVRVVVLTFPYKKEFFENNYSSENFIIEPLDIDDIVRSPRAKFWYRLGFLLQNTTYVKDQRKERLYNNQNLIGYVNYFLVSLTALMLSRIRVARSIYRFLDYKFSKKDLLDSLIKKYNPNLFFSTDVFGEWDVALIRCASFRKIKTLGMVRSWDNTTTKGVLRHFPDYMIALSPNSVDELYKFHNWNGESRTIISGLPQFDGWEKGPTLSRDEFFKKIGVSPSRRIIVFAPAGSILSDSDWQICEILKKAINDKKIPEDVTFLIRNHPHHPADLSKFKPDGHFVIESPGQILRGEDSRGSEMSKEDNNHLRNTVYYSEIIMYVATSLGLDASIYDKPQILVSFDGYNKKPYVVSVKRYNREDCLANLVSLGGTRVVESEGALVESINNYLENPELNRGGRIKTIERHLFKTDGQAANRIADYLISLLK